MNKQEFQQTIKNMKPPKFFTAVTINEAYEAGFEEAKGNALCNSCFLNEPEKPVVPKFVAEYIEYCKHEKFYALHGAYDNMDDRLKCWRFKGNNSELFAKAWLYGYEVEKEQMYTVEIPNPNRVTEPIIYLSRGEEGKIFLNSWFVYESKNWKNQPYAQLTESEIKEDFEWAWPFAKEVKE